MKTVMLVVLLMVCGCDDGVPVIEKKVHADNEKPLTARFSVESQGKFRAGYGDHEREVMIITDTKTHRQYLVITGCGVTEMWQETCGKTVVTREE